MIKPRYNRACAIIKPRYNHAGTTIKPRYNRADAMASDKHGSNAVFIDRTTDREDSTVNPMPGARSSATVRARSSATVMARSSATVRSRSSATHLKEATTIDLFQEEAIAAITAAIAPLV